MNNWKATTVAALIGAGAVASAMNVRARAGSPLHDAVKVWHFADGKSIKTTGVVKTDVALDGGGTGIESGGGWVELTDEDGSLNRINGHGFTLHTRIRNAKGDVWDAPVITKQSDQGGGLAWRLYGRWFGKTGWDSEGVQNYPSFGNEDGEGYALEFCMGFTLPERLHHVRQKIARGQADGFEREHSLWRVGLPAAMIKDDAWHEITVTFDGARLSLYLDGNLVDRNFPLGTVRANDAPVRIGADGKGASGFSGSVDVVAVWDRALSEAEIVSMCGGAEAVARADREIFGDKPAMAMHYLPKWHNAWINETVGADFRDSFNIYYSAWIRGWLAKGAEIHLARSPNLRDWRYGGVAIPVERQWEGFWMSSMPPQVQDGALTIPFCNSMPAGIQTTGLPKRIVKPSMQDGKSQWRAVDLPNPDVHLPTEFPSGPLRALSVDGITFEKEDRLYGAYHTPSLFQSPEVPGRDFITSGRGTLFTSSDRRNWELSRRDLIQTGQDGEEVLTDECWFLFDWNDWYYTFAGGGLDAYRAKDIFGPYWEGPNGEFKDQCISRDFHPARGYHVFSMFKTRDNRAFVFGMTPHWPDGRKGRVSGILTVHELVQMPDGRLGNKWPNELRPQTANKLAWNVKTTSGGARVDGDTIEIDADSFGFVSISGLPESYHLKARVVPEKGVGRFGLNINGSTNPDSKKGCEIGFDLGLERVQYNNSRQDLLGPASPATFDEAPLDDQAKNSFPKYADDPDNRVWKLWKNRRTCPWLGNEYALEDVAGLDRPFTLEVIVEPVRHNDKERARWWIIDTQIDNRLAFVAQRQDMENIGNLSFFVKNRTVRFENIEIRPLK
jgi:hypothetical protein